MGAVFLCEFQPRKGRTECRSATSTAVTAADKTVGVEIHAIRGTVFLAEGERRNLSLHSALGIGKSESTGV